jgi:hypothetical protein
MAAMMDNQKMFVLYKKLNFRFFVMSGQYISACVAKISPNLEIGAPVTENAICCATKNFPRFQIEGKSVVVEQGHSIPGNYFYVFLCVQITLARTDLQQRR